MGVTKGSPLNKKTFDEVYQLKVTPLGYEGVKVPVVPLQIPISSITGGSGGAPLIKLRGSKKRKNNTNLILPRSRLQFSFN